MSAELKLSINISPSIKPLKSLITCNTGLSFCAVSENRLNDFYTATHTTKTATASSSPGFTYYIKITLH